MVLNIKIITSILFFSCQIHIILSIKSINETDVNIEYLYAFSFTITKI